MKKYDFTSKTVTENGAVLRRIKALIDIPEANVSVGDVGGFIETEDNLSHDGDCWVHDDACIFGNARVYGDAQISDNARVFGNARISDEARVYNNARISGNAKISGTAGVSGNSHVFGNSHIFGNVSIRDAMICGNAVCY